MKQVSSPQVRELAEQVLRGDRRALARAISFLEEGQTAARELVALLYPHGGKAHTIGVTGAPGTGKSTLVNALAGGYRRRGLTVGVVAVDPTSPFTGGALLGDRLRMRDLSGDPGVFIRSMATRGATGGLARAAGDVALALDAAGYERIFIETVGAGQDEVEVASLAHTVLVVEAPGLGDDVQVLKAGLLETANVLVVNKADRDGAGQTLAALRAMLELAGPAPATVDHHGVEMRVAATVPAEREGDPWPVPVVATVATEGRGVEEVLDAIEAHRRHTAASPATGARCRRRAETELARALDEALRRLLAEQMDPAAYQEAVQAVLSRAVDPHTAAGRLIGALRRGRARHPGMPALERKGGAGCSSDPT
ncbi:MAG: methylmalonyl Co-A mutase-associated GTPase MeaB [Anaerolineae bacterium]|nr:methylmalonyl Co-A mutase-associated GTPase MeaB [Anaerolineae bacterium]